MKNAATISRMHNLSILSYNLKLHAAYVEAFEFAAKHDVDVICLQECLGDQLVNRIGHYRLACRTTRGRLELAIYYRDDRLQFLDTVAKSLAEPLNQRANPWYSQRFLMAKFLDLRSNKPVLIASFHATHLVALNSLRRRQMTEVFQTIDQYHAQSKTLLPTVIAGDYNYPLFHRRLRKFVTRQGYDLFLTRDVTYRSGIVRGKFDFASTRHIAHTDMTVLPQGGSDHLPVHIQARYQG